MCLAISESDYATLKKGRSVFAPYRVIKRSDEIALGTWQEARTKGVNSKGGPGINTILFPGVRVQSL